MRETPKTVSPFGFDLKLGQLLSASLAPAVEGSRWEPVADSLGQAACGEPPAPNPFDVLRQRGISEAVQAARGYVPYFGKFHPSHEPERVTKALDSYTLSDNQRRFYTKVTNAARGKLNAELVEGYGDGLLMPKYPVPGAGPILPQLRPRYAVEMDKRGDWHRHDKAYKGKPDELKRHLEGEHVGSLVGLNEWHRHDSLAKYLLAPLAKVRVSHSHDDDPVFFGVNGERKRRAHERSRRYRHTEADLTGAVHSHNRPARGQHVADRLDIHPWALERLPEAERVYFSIEGTPKADAILTRIIEREGQASVFDVPSVTLWKAPELKSFSERLKGRLVVVVPDMDWHSNPNVVRQAFLCREYLRDECGLTVCVAAPPIDQGHKGVDDYLEAGGELDHLEVVDREAPFSLALYADSDGRIRSSVWGFAKLLGCRRDALRVLEVLERHISHGFLSVDRELLLDIDEWSELEDWRGQVDEWPVFTVRENLRYTESHCRLRDYLPKPRFALEVSPSAAPDEWPNTRGIPAFVKRVAAERGVSTKAIRAWPEIKQLRTMHDQMIRSYMRRWPQEIERAARLFGVSKATVRRKTNLGDG